MQPRGMDARLPGPPLRRCPGWAPSRGLRPHPAGLPRCGAACGRWRGLQSRRQETPSRRPFPPSSTLERPACTPTHTVK